MILWLALACARDPASGTAVGNPGGNVGLAVTDVPDDVVLDAVDVAADHLLLEPCGGEVDVIAANQTFDALDPSDQIAVDGGRYCAAILVLDSGPAGSVDVVGATASGTDFELGVDLSALGEAGRFTAGETPLLLGVSLSGVDVAAIDALGPIAQIPPGDPLSEDVAASASGGLWRDVDADGRIGAGDEAVLGGEPPTFENSAASAEGGSGCDTAGLQATGGWLAALVALCRRRRR